MEISMQVIVTAAKRYDFDGNKGAQIYTLGDMIEEDDRIGCPVMKLTAEYGVVDNLRGVKFPAKFDLKCNVQVGAKDSMKYHVIGAMPVLSGQQEKVSQTAKA
ncbi:hypothetical protein [Neptunomonas sp.]|uniref:hypothetical protein n=1 Tax=Neptunomonas sp. TaxID=1971898 RepID=UPI0025F553AA|nr:hypothetical protein [Neptunomonas sp.]